LAISALAISVVVFVVVGIAVELAFLPKASSPGNATTSAANGCQAASSAGGSPPSTIVKTSVDQLVKDFNIRDVSGMSDFYAADSCVKWVGAPGLEGVYLGQGNVRILYGSSIGKTIWLNVSASNYAETAASPSNVNVSMTLDMRGNSTVVGGLNATIDATQQWNYNGGKWQIVKENWNYVTFKVQYPQPSTTFPQWTALKTGHNPDLISEKSFEWHAGPYIAALVYAFLAGVLAFGAMAYRRRSRTIN
jgi:hypothetical protein